MIAKTTRTAERKRVVERAVARASRLFRHRWALEKLSYHSDDSARVNERDHVGHSEKFLPKMYWMDLWHCRLRGMKRYSPSYPSGVVDGIPNSAISRTVSNSPLTTRCSEKHLDSLVASLYQVELRSVTRNGSHIEQGVPVAEVTPGQVFAFVLEILSHRS